MKTNQELKNAALAALKGNWAQAILAAVFMCGVTVVLSSPTYIIDICSSEMSSIDYMDSMLLLMVSNIGFLLSLFLLYPLTLGYAVAHKDLLLYGDASVTRNTLRHAFSGYMRNVLAMLLTYLFTALWTLLFIIPGIVKSLAYSMTLYIIKDYPELSPNQAINLSIKMMKGHKFDLFCLSLSFIGWVFLSILTLGVGLIWLMPYMQTTMAAFYQDVKNDYIARETAI